MSFHLSIAVLFFLSVFQQVTSNTLNYRVCDSDSTVSSVKEVSFTVSPDSANVSLYLIGEFSFPKLNISVHHGDDYLLRDYIFDFCTLAVCGNITNVTLVLPFFPGFLSDSVFHISWTDVNQPPQCIHSKFPNFENIAFDITLWFLIGLNILMAIMLAFFRRFMTRSILVPSLLDFILWLQFISQLGMLNLDYPEFFVHVISREFGWASFMGSWFSGFGFFNTTQNSGLPRYALSIGLSSENLALSTYVSASIVLIVLTLFVLLAFAVDRTSNRRMMGAILGGVWCRVVLVISAPLVLTAIYQITSGPYKLSTFIVSSFVIVQVIVAVGIFIKRVLDYRRRWHNSLREANREWIVRFGAIIDSSGKHWIPLANFKSRMLIAVFIGSLGLYPTLQLTLVALMELGNFTVTLILAERHSFKRYYFSFSRFAMLILLIPFMPSLELGYTIRELMGRLIISLVLLQLFVHGLVSAYAIYRRPRYSQRHQYVSSAYPPLVRLHRHFGTFKPPENEFVLIVNDPGSPNGTLTPETSSSFFSRNVPLELSDDEYDSLIHPEVMFV